MAYKRIPKNYNVTEYPLPHNFNVKFNLNLDDAATKYGTFVPILLSDEGLVNADLVIANPEHGSFAEVAYAHCYKNSIIDNLSIRFRAKLTKAAIETDKIQNITLYVLPIYTSFISRLEASDSKTGVSVEDILELTHETAGKSIQPIYAAKLTVGTTLAAHSDATVALMGMTTTRALETIIFDTALFYDALQFYTNSAMLKKVIGRMMKLTVGRDFPKFMMFRGVKGIIKRINEYTLCGYHVFVGKAGTTEQMMAAGDVTSVDHITISFDVRYDEWNNQFDQTSS